MLLLPCHKTKCCCCPVIGRYAVATLSQDEIIFLLPYGTYMDNCSGHLRLATMYTRASSWISRPFRLSPSLSPVANYSGVSSGNCSLLYVWCILYLYIHSISIMRKAFIHCLYTSSGTNRPSLCSIFHSVVHDLLFRAGENEECRETKINYSRGVFTKNFRSWPASFALSHVINVRVAGMKLSGRRDDLFAWLAPPSSKWVIKT